MMRTSSGGRESKVAILVRGEELSDRTLEDERMVLI